MGTKLILTDLDETLLHSDKTISDYSVRVFNECKQRGILVGFCTSRGKTNIVPFEKRINPDICICNGGASIYHNGTLLHAASFTIQETRSILEETRNVCDPNCEITVDTIDKIQADSYCDSLEKQLLEKDKDSYSNRFDPDYCDGEEFDDITPEEFQLYIPKVNEDNDEAEEDSAEYRRYYDFDNTFEDSNFNA